VALTKIRLYVRPKYLKGCCRKMTSELPSSAVGFTISPSPEARKLVGTEKRTGENKLFSSADEKQARKWYRLSLSFWLHWLTVR